MNKTKVLLMVANNGHLKMSNTPVKTDRMISQGELYTSDAVDIIKRDLDKELKVKHANTASSLAIEHRQIVDAMQSQIDSLEAKLKELVPTPVYEYEVGVADHPSITIEAERFVQSGDTAWFYKSKAMVATFIGVTSIIKQD